MNAGRRVGHQHRQRHGGHHGHADQRPDHDRGGRHGDVHHRARRAADGRRDDRACSSSDTTEGTVVAGVADLHGANWNTPQTVTVTGVDDVLDDGDVAYTIVTAAATSADANYNGIECRPTCRSRTPTTTRPGITVTPTSGPGTTEAGGTATFTVVLDSQPTADVTIGLSSSDATEGTVSPAIADVHAARTGTRAQTVTVTGVNDDLDDGDVAYTIVTAAATSADGNYNGIERRPTSRSRTPTTTRRGITVTTDQRADTTEAGGTATFTVVLTRQPTADVTIGAQLQRHDRRHGRRRRR